MAGERVLPGAGLKGFWTPGSSGWNGADQMDGNWLKLSVLTQLTALSRVSSLPASPTDGQVYLTAGGVSVRDNGAWVTLVPATGWRAYVVDEDADYRWKGGAWVLIA